MNNIKKAKKIFFEYDGSMFYMSHDGYYQEYKKYNISKDIESIWEEELIIQRMHEYEISSNSSKLRTIIYFSKYNLLENILNVKIRGTYINKIVILEDLIDFIIKGKKNIESGLLKKSKNILHQEYLKLIKKEIPKKYIPNQCKSRLELIIKKLNNM